MLARLKTLSFWQIFGWTTVGHTTSSSTRDDASQSNEPVALSDEDRDQAAEVSFWGLTAFPVL